MTARDDIAFLVGSECRVETLRALREEPLRPSGLAEEVSCARETAQRNLAGFTERSWVTKQNSSYRLTTAGQMVLQRYEQLEQSVENAKNLDVFLSNVGPVAEAVDTDLLAAQTVTTSTPENPHGPIDRWLSLVDGVVDAYYGVTPIVSRVFNEAAAQSIGPDTHMELVIDESVLEASREKFTDALELAYELDQFVLWLAPSDLEYGLAIIDDHVWFAAYDDFGNIVASVDGDDEEFVEWAYDRYTGLRERSAQAEPESLST
ncbi:helix-turn-helix transcriptional regulator [Salinigranum halophilum]|jgi:predicted transcriptional regulator|uniref:helix-turn-helix transcriptional regulator n=1 Tax=Salinigranum halophilum TaxID=2565931 RepID=UPI00191BDF70|nr:hypothetical protein [Salinigranum halophilum]